MKLRMFVTHGIVENLVWTTLRRERVAYRKVLSEQRLENCCCSFHGSLKIEKILVNDQHILLTSIERICCHSISSQFKCFSSTRKKDFQDQFSFVLFSLHSTFRFFSSFVHRNDFVETSKWFLRHGKEFQLEKINRDISPRSNALKTTNQFVGWPVSQELIISANFWIRPLFLSVTKMFPSTSKLIVLGYFNWLDPAPPTPEHPTTHRKPFGPDQRYPSPSTTISVDRLFPSFHFFVPIETIAHDCWYYRSHQGRARASQNFHEDRWMSQPSIPTDLLLPWWSKYSTDQTTIVASFDEDWMQNSRDDCSRQQTGHDIVRRKKERTLRRVECRSSVVIVSSSFDSQLNCLHSVNWLGSI